ncbi:hypothetical protein K4L44_05850 [Halosquirtibacter laminarini]|uniref:Uncharacterized protein n=1 Tax=Halosquirtibacter laminarini TaxID=3374600 RepID=A0AC61NI36_9BACT|nr:hypothetical protein K4L44_05850 [Prolixibacteraceae bacterium]
MYKNNRAQEVGQYNTPLEILSRMLFRSPTGAQQEEWKGVGYLLADQRKETSYDGVMKRPKVVFATHKRDDIYVGQRLREDHIIYEIDEIVRDHEEMEMICKRV